MLDIHCISHKRNNTRKALFWLDLDIFAKLCLTGISQNTLLIQQKEVSMTQLADEKVWHLLRLNVKNVGWPHIIRTEILEHFFAIRDNNDASTYKTLHLFYEKIATPEERKHMLAGGYQPLC
jgi:hypothetical protein